MTLYKWNEGRGGWAVIIICGLFWSTKVSHALKCYQCIAIECPESQTQLFCESVKEYLFSQLPDLYYNYQGQKVRLCPSPDEEDKGWEELRKGTSYTCEEEKENDATCALGRFRITTEIFETGKNISTHGTVMGCAKFALLKLTRQAVSRSECDMSSSKSGFKHSLRQYLEIEHCARPPDMCHGQDFCIPPYATKIKRFQDDPKKESFPFTLVLGIFLLLALAVIVLTFLAPYFNG